MNTLIREYLLEKNTLNKIFFLIFFDHFIYFVCLNYNKTYNKTKIGISRTKI